MEVRNQPLSGCVASSQGVALGIALAIGLLPALASGVDVAPGEGVAVPAEALAPASVLAQRLEYFEIASAAGEAVATGTVQVRALRSAGGALLFDYRASVDPDSPGPLDFVILFGFTGFSTDLVSAPGPGPAIESASRSGNGGTLSLFFPSGGLLPGESSRALRIRSDAPGFARDGMLRAQSGLRTLTFASVPLPSSETPDLVDCRELRADLLPALGHRVVADELGRSLLEVDPGTATRTLMSDGPLGNDRDLVATPDGRLLVVQAERILRVDPADQSVEVIAVTGAAGEGIALSRATLDGPDALIVRNGSSVARVDLASGLLTTLLTVQSPCGGFEPLPPCGLRDIAVAAGGTIFAAVGPPVDEFGIWVLPRDGSTPTLFASGFFPNPVGDPEALAFGPDGLLYVINANSVASVDPDSAEQNTVSQGGLLARPNDIAAGPSRRLAITLRGAGVPSFPTPVVATVNVDSGAQAIASAHDLLREPTTVTVDRAGRILVLDSHARAVIALDPVSGAQVPWVFGAELVSPAGVDVDAAGNIAVGSSEGLLRFDPISGRRTRIWRGPLRPTVGGHPARDVEFDPVGHAVVSAIAEDGLRRIDAFTGDATVLAESAGSTGRLASAADGSLLFVTGARRIWRLALDGSLTSLVEPPPVFAPIGVVAALGQTLFFDHRGATGNNGQGGMSRVGPAPGSATLVATGLGFPEGADVADDGRLVIANLAGSIAEWTPAGDFLRAYPGGAGPTDVRIWRGCARPAPCGDVDLDDRVSNLDLWQLRDLLASGKAPNEAQALRCSVSDPGDCSIADAIVLARALQRPPLPPGIASVCALRGS